jgi:hypothetical protein
LNNKKVNQAIKYTTTRLVEIIIKRALEIEGIKDPDRRKIFWAKKFSLVFIHAWLKPRTIMRATNA